MCFLEPLADQFKLWFLLGGFDDLSKLFEVVGVSVDETGEEIDPCCSSCLQILIRVRQTHLHYIASRLRLIKSISFRGSRLRREIKAAIGVILIRDPLASEGLFSSFIYSSTCRKFTN
jgi:hypothetical protein